MTNKVYSVDEIRSIVTPIAVEYGLSRVFLFGSYARGSVNGASDIDICVDAANLKGMFALGGLYADLADAFDKNLDLITERSLDYSDDRSFVDNLRKEQVLLYENS